MRSCALTAIVAMAASALGSPALEAADYRGMSAGWPVYANGYYAAGYAAQPAAGPAYYVARPATVAQAAAPARTGVMYMPVRAAYANPTYFAAYGRSPTAYQPVTTAGYAPAAGYYAPVTANYAPVNSYAVTPAGMSSAGSEAAAYYGQPAPVNYVPPRFAYRTTYAATPVYMYRPVTTYDPITAQPVTCLQASTTCQPTCQRQQSWFSWLHPANWFSGSSSCSGSRCGAAPVTSYCGTAASQCGQPYYPIQPVTPVVPIVPAPATTIPSTTLPPNTIPAAPRGIVVPPAGTTIPPPPTVTPGTRGVITTPGLAPEFTQPRLPAGTVVPAPGSTFTPGTTITPLPSNPVPGGTFGAPPATTVPPGSFPTTPSQPPTGFGSGSFGSGANYPPASDPYTPALTPANGPATPVQAPTDKSSPPHSVFGSGYRASPAREKNDQVIRAPEMPPSVRTVPDLDAAQPPRPANSAPQLLNPRDKTAGVNNRWAVVPAVWPKNQPSRVGSAHHVSSGGTTGQPSANQPNQADYDDRGWRSAF
jgi:hypothetical protein